MIIFFGPPGSGKSTQGKILAERYDWRWMSVGELLRQFNDPSIAKIMEKGDIVEKNIVNRILFEAIGEDRKIILDGYPRNKEQVKDFLQKYENAISVVIVLDIPENEIKNRLLLRKRAEDKDDVIPHRIEIYNNETQPVLDILKNNNIVIKYVDGVGSIDEVNNRIEKILKDMKIIKEA